MTIDLFNLKVGFRKQKEPAMLAIGIDKYGFYLFLIWWEVGIIWNEKEKQEQ